MIRRFALSLAAAISGGVLMQPPAQADDALPRKPALGAALKPTADEPALLEIVQALPGGTAEAAGLMPGDLILAIDGVKIHAPPHVAQALADNEPGDEVELIYRRDGEDVTTKAEVHGRPRESSDDYRVEYGHVTSRGHRLRTIVTVPHDDARHPALLVIQGLGMYSVDAPIGGLASYIKIPETLTRAGIVTMRVEKPGVGDSEGGPAPEVDFEAELDAYRQALKALKARPDIDPEKVYIWGHSMGGIMGPIIARDEPVRGIAVYGTGLKGWSEYLLENTRRQMLLSGAPHSEVERFNRDQQKFLHLFAVEKLTPEQVADRRPELADFVKEAYPDGQHQFGRTYKFFHQLHDQNMPEHWEYVDAHVLAVWGEADFVSGADDHAAIAEILNRKHEGKGRFVALPESDHGFARYSTQKEAQSAEGPPAEYNPAFAELLRDWILETSRGE